MEMNLTCEQISWRNAFLSTDNESKFVHYTVAPNDGPSTALESAIAAYMLATPNASIAIVSAIWTTQQSFRLVLDVVLKFLQGSENVARTRLMGNELSLWVEGQSDRRFVRMYAPLPLTKGVGEGLLVLHEIDTMLKVDNHSTYGSTFCKEYIYPLMHTKTRVLSFSVGDGSALREVLCIKDDDV